MLQIQKLIGIEIYSSIIGKDKLFDYFSSKELVILEVSPKAWLTIFQQLDEMYDIDVAAI